MSTSEDHKEKKDTKALESLLTAFEVTCLGEGDTNAGANLLATMAVTLADLAPTDNTILTKDERPARLGVNLLVTGPASAGLVEDEILPEVSRRQANLWNYLQRYAEHIKQQQQKQGASLPPMDPKSGAPEDRVAETQYELESLCHTRAESWGRIFTETPEEDVTALINRPKFVVGLRSPEDLPAQLRGLRPGHTLVHAGCTRPKDLAAQAESGSALVGGRYPLGNGCETARGHFFITDPLRMLDRATREPDGDTAWLGHFLWLCDGEAGPQAPTDGREANRPEMVTTRFRVALDSILARRMNAPEKEPLHLVLDTREARIRFRAFLAGMEPRLPGISMAAWNLIDSLTFGLGRMAAIARLDPRSYDAIHPFSREPAEGLEERLPLSVAGIEALARFLVHRMSNARTVMAHADDVARRQWQIRRIFRKLEQGPAEARKIYRNLGLLAADCDGCLGWMEKAGIAFQINRRWELAEEAVLRFENHPIPLLEV
jgi:hypothetical protein